MAQAEIGLIGLGVMGSNLALNIAEKGNRIAVFNRTAARTKEFYEEAGALKDQVDMAWDAVKAKLVRGVSIGFRALEYSFMDNGGIRFTEIEVYELSLVTIPANASATIQSIKAMDTAGRVAQTASLGVPLVKCTPTAKPEGGAVRLHRATS